MPSYPADPQLLSAVKRVVAACANNQSEAARRLKTTRLRINRLIAQQGRVAEATRRDLWEGIRAVRGQEDEFASDPPERETTQQPPRIDDIARQVIQLIKTAVETCYPEGGDDARSH